MIEIILGIVLMIFLLYITQHIKKSKECIYDPFGFRQLIICKLSCEKCGVSGIKSFERGDFIFKSIRKCPMCKEGNMLITEILCFEAKVKTKAELKYEKLVKKWK